MPEHDTISDEDTVLDVRGLSVGYRTTRGERTAVDAVDLQVRRGEILGIAGESGCGKSTLAVSILRLLKPPGHVTGGTMTFRTRLGESFDLSSLRGNELRDVRWKHLAYLPQASMNSLNPVSRIQDQFEDVMRRHLTLSDQELGQLIRDLLAQVGLPFAVARMYPHELSGGMKQRVVTALSVALTPDLLVADEPTTALDVTAQRLIIQNLIELRDRFAVTVLLITHDMGVHAQLADRVAVMSAGKIVEIGDVHQIFKQPQHEYTRRLINSIPTLDVNQRRVEQVAD